MGVDDPAEAGAAGRCLCLPFRGRGRSLPRGGWGPSSSSGATYEIRSSHSRRIPSQRSNSNCRDRKGSTSACGISSYRPPKLGSTEPHLSCFLLLQQQPLPQQLPTVLCPSCAAAAASSGGCFSCTAKEGAAASLAAPPSTNLLRVPSCSSQGSSSFHDGDSEGAPSATAAAAAAAAASAAAPATGEGLLHYSSGRREHVSRTSTFKNRFPCAACWKCSNNSSISIKVLELPTANGSIIPALFLQHPAGQQTLLLSHDTRRDLGSTYPLLVLLCRSLSTNVMAYEYTGYGFCCCSSRTKQQQQRQGRLCTASAAAVYADIRAAFVWLLQQQQQTPQSIILYSEGRGLLPAFRLRSELDAEGLQLGGLVFVSPAASAAAAAAAAAAEAAGQKRDTSRLSRLVPSCCRKPREIHEVYMQLLQLQEDELLVLEGVPESPQGPSAGEIPQLLLRQRAAAAATIPEPEATASCCACSDFPTGENLRRLKEYVERVGEQQQQQLVIDQHQQLLVQQQLCRSLLEKEEKALARNQQPKCCKHHYQQQQQPPQQRSEPSPCDGEAATDCQMQLSSPSPSPDFKETSQRQ